MFFRKKSKKNIFHLQQDGRFGTLQGRVSTETNLEEFLATKSKHYSHGSLKVSVNSKRLRIGFICLFSVMALFIARSAQLQIMEGEHYASLSSQNKQRTELIVPPRGSVFDRNGQPLAWNSPAFVLTMTPANLPAEEDRIVLFEHVSQLVGLQPTDLDLLLTEYGARSYEPIPIEDNLPYETAIRLAVEISQLPGFNLVTRTKRVYTSTAPSLSHILGYTGSLSSSEFEMYAPNGYRLIDSIGKTGIEKTEETNLRGIPGRLTYEVDAFGNKLSILSKEDFTLGTDISLSIDLELQTFIERSLEETFDQVDAYRGTVIAMNPQNGEIYALVSLPTFDSNEFVDGISTARYQSLLEDPNQPLFFRGISGEFPSGSTFKPFVLYAALVEGIVNEHTSFLSTGGVRIGQWFFPDWKAGGHGTTDARKAISESVNTYFYIIGGGLDGRSGLGVEQITNYASYFGFGSETGIDLPNEADGFLPSKEWKEDVKQERWYVGDTYHLAIGQGDFLTTPIQMAVATSIIANGGSVITPQIVLSESEDKNVNTETINLDKNAIEIVRQAMRQTITEGSARSLSQLSVDIGGKTGTAQTIGDRPYHSWFTGFAPYQEPTFSLVVLVEEGGESNDAAVPLARSIFDWWFSYSQ